MSLISFYILWRWIHFCALISLAGAVTYTTLLAPKRYRADLSQSLQLLFSTACVVNLIGALLLISVQTGLMGEGWRDVTNADVWSAVLQTHFGRIWQWQCLLALAGCLVLLLRDRLRQQLLLLFAVGQLVLLAFVGHAAILDGWPGVWQRGNQMLHLLAVAFWAGGLFPVLLLMREVREGTQRYDAICTMMRFSRYGHLAVALVILSGAVNAGLLLGWPPDSFRLYSQLLLLKILLVAVMMAIALYNRYWLVPRFERCGEEAQRQFIACTLAEVILAALVLLAVSLFATLEPA